MKDEEITTFGNKEAVRVGNESEKGGMWDVFIIEN
jgi:hypothetical protein